MLAPPETSTLRPIVPSTTPLPRPDQCVDWTIHHPIQFLSGVLRQKGVECHHCARTVSVSGFATCAAQVLGIGPGRPQGRAVLRHIFTKDGRSLEHCVQQMEAANGDAATSTGVQRRRPAPPLAPPHPAALAHFHFASPSLFSTRHDPLGSQPAPPLPSTTAGGALMEECISPAPEPAPAPEFSDELCRMCGEGGPLLCCETCPATFHLACIGLNASRVRTHTLPPAPAPGSVLCVGSPRERKGPHVPLQAACRGPMARLRQTPLPLGRSAP